MSSQCVPASCHDLGGWGAEDGRLFGREMALILCGEAHEDAIDVTRKHRLFPATRGVCRQQCPRRSSFHLVPAFAARLPPLLQSTRAWVQGECIYAGRARVGL